MTSKVTLSENVDIEALAKDLMALRAELRQELSIADLNHLKKIERWGRLCGFLGLATAWIVPNPISAFLISQAKLTRWTMIAHHVLHKGYDKIPDIPVHYTSKGFARGWRRYIDWFDWLLPEAWIHEHNMLHHYHLGETHDPDCIEHRVNWLRNMRLPVLIKYLIILFLACTWKITYYASNTLNELHSFRTRGTNNKPETDYPLLNVALWNPLNPKGYELWTRCFLPYFAWNFIGLPLLFLPLGQVAAINVLLNQLLAEIFTNLHTFSIIVTNHAGEDLHTFDSKLSGKEEFYFRQIIGSTNFATGGDFVGFLHGWLNYHIEHHLWPDLTMLQYQKAQPRVKAICEKHGVSYVQESVLTRLYKTIAVIAGQTTVPNWNYQTGRASPNSLE